MSARNIVASIVLLAVAWQGNIGNAAISDEPPQDCGLWLYSNYAEHSTNMDFAEAGCFNGVKRDISVLWPGATDVNGMVYRHHSWFRPTEASLRFRDADGRTISVVPLEFRLSCHARGEGDECWTTQHVLVPAKAASATIKATINGAPRTHRYDRVPAL